MLTYKVFSPAHPVLIVFHLIVLGILGLTLYFLLSHKNRKQFANQLAANVVIGNIVIGILTLLADVLIGAGCDRPGICAYIRAMETGSSVIFAYTFIMFNIERLMFIKDPIGHGQKIKKCSSIIMLSFPWIMAVILMIAEGVTVVKQWTDYLENHAEKDPIRPYETNMTDEENYRYYTCIQYLDFSFFNPVKQILLYPVPGLIYFACAISALVMWCLFKKQHRLGTDYLCMGGAVQNEVRATVIALCILDFVIPVYMFGTMAFHMTSAALYYFSFVTMAIFLAEAIAFIGIFANVRSRIADCCHCLPCCRGDPSSEDQVKYEPDKNVA